MAATSSKQSAKASMPPRDASGHFISKDTPPTQASKVTITTSGPIETVQKPGLDTPLFSLTVSNPFKKLINWLDEIRRKQTTSFSFEVKIPLLALPIFLAVLGASFQFFFNLGKSDIRIVAATPTTFPTDIPKPIHVSKSGILSATYQVKELAASSSSEVAPTAIPYRYVLVDTKDGITFLIPPKDLTLTKYLSQRVLITGLFDQEKNTLTILTKEDIELLSN